MKNKKRGISIFATFRFLFCTGLIAACLTSGAYAEYTSAYGNSDAAKAAKFSVSESGECFTGEISVSVWPGDSMDYSLSIQNCSEVAVRCLITAENMTGNLVKTEQDGSRTQLLTCTLNGGTESEEGEWYVDLKPGESSDGLSLTVSFADNVDPIYMGQADSLEFTVRSVQID